MSKSADDPMEQAVAAAAAVAAEEAAKADGGKTSSGHPPPRRTRAKSGGRASAKGSEPASGSPPRAGGDAAPPPRQRASAGSSAPRAPRVPNLKGQLEQYFGAMALIPATVGDDYSAQIISTRAGYLAEAWSELAKQNPAVRRVLEGLVSGGAWGGAVMASMSVVIPIAGHYGLLPAIDPWHGMMPPVSVPQGDRRQRHHMPPAEPAPTGPTGVVPVPPGVAAEVITERPAFRNGGPTETSTGGTDVPEEMTPPIIPGEPPGVVTVAGVERASQQTRVAQGSAAPDGGDGRVARDPMAALRARAGIDGSAAPSGGGGGVTRVPPIQGTNGAAKPV